MFLLERLAESWVICSLVSQHAVNKIANRQHQNHVIVMGPLNDASFLWLLEPFGVFVHKAKGCECTYAPVLNIPIT